MYDDSGYPLAAQEKAAMAPRRSSITERLELEAKRLNERLVEINTALAALKKYPDMQAVIDIIAKTI